MVTCQNFYSIEPTRLAEHAKHAKHAQQRQLPTTHEENYRTIKQGARSTGDHRVHGRSLNSLFIRSPKTVLPHCCQAANISDPFPKSLDFSSDDGFAGLTPLPWPSGCLVPVSRQHQGLSSDVSHFHNVLQSLR